MLIQLLYVALRIGIEVIEYFLLHLFRKKYATYDPWL